MSDELDTFLQLLAGSDPGERLLEVRHRPQHGQAGMRQRFIPARDLAAAGELIAWQGARSDTYVGVLLRDRPRGGRDAVSRSHLLFVEIDSQDALECLRRAPAPATAVVSSGIIRSRCSQGRGVAGDERWRHVASAAVVVDVGGGCTTYDIYDLSVARVGRLQALGLRARRWGRG